MRRLALLALLAPLARDAAAAPTGIREWKSEMHRLDGDAARYWRELSGRLSQVFIDFRAELEKADAKPDEHREATHDYAPWRTLYEDYARIERDRGKADLALARSGDAKALATLFDALLDVAKRIDDLEDELDQGKPKVRYFIFDPRFGIERTALALRLEALIDALSQCPEAPQYLPDTGWKRAERADGRDSVTRRVALMDAMARVANDQVRPALEAQLSSRSSFLRVAAAEALFAFGAAARPALETALQDPSPVVRRAVLQSIRAHAAKDGGWIRPVLASFERAQGHLRIECVQTLEALTHQKFGHAPAKWKEWLDIYGKEIDAGNFDAEKIEVQEVEPVPPEGGFRFYGVPSFARGVVFVLEATQFMAMPADWEVQRTEYKDKWPGLRAQWEQKWPSHQTILERELGATLGSMGRETPFGLVALTGVFVVQTEPEKGLFPPGPAATKQALRLVEKMPMRGWCSQFEGIRAGARMGGLAPEERVDIAEPKIDTVFLLGPGDPSGGRYMTPEATLAAFRRFNRFRRLVIHTIRIANEGEASEILMKGLAEASGGTYVWQKQPPG